MLARLPSRFLPLSLIIGLGLSLGAAPRAQAGSVLVLGFVEDGKPNAAVRQSVMQFLSRMGEEVVSTSLPNADQLCTQTDCLVRLGEKHRAQRLVGGELIRNDSSYRILVWLFDRVSEMPNSAETSCTDCNTEMLADMVSRTVGRALEVGAAPPPPPPVLRQSQLTSVAEVAAPSSPRRCGSSYMSFGRGIAIGSLAATTAAGLATGIGLAIENGRVYKSGDGMGPDQVYNFGNHTKIAFGLTALSAVGLTLATIPWRSLLYGRAERTIEVCTRSPRWSFNRGTAIGAFGAMALMGLISSLALTGMNGAQYDTNLDGTPVSYSLKPHYTAASIVSAGMLIGLGVSLFWP